DLPRADQQREFSISELYEYRAARAIRHEDELPAIVERADPKAMLQPQLCVADPITQPNNRLKPVDAGRVGRRGREQCKGDDDCQEPDAHHCSAFRGAWGETERPRFVCPSSLTSNNLLPYSPLKDTAPPVCAELLTGELTD